MESMWILPMSLGIYLITRSGKMKDQVDGLMFIANNLRGIAWIVISVGFMLRWR